MTEAEESAQAQAVMVGLSGRAACFHCGWLCKIHLFDDHFYCTQCEVWWTPNGDLLTRQRLRRLER